MQQVFSDVFPTEFCGIPESEAEIPIPDPPARGAVPAEFPTKFKTRSITIDEIILPMRNIDNLTSKTKVKEAWAISNALAHEPISTELATQRVVKILDAN